MVQQKAVEQGRNVLGISSCDACSKIRLYDIKGVWPNLGDVPTPFFVFSFPPLLSFISLIYNFIFLTKVCHDCAIL